MTILTFNSIQRKWLCEFIRCNAYNLIAPVSISDEDIIHQTLYSDYYFEFERSVLNEYLKKYPLALLQLLVTNHKLHIADGI